MTLSKFILHFKMTQCSNPELQMSTQRTSVESSSVFPHVEL